MFGKVTEVFGGGEGLENLKDPRGTDLEKREFNKDCLKGVFALWLALNIPFSANEAEASLSQNQRYIEELFYKLSDLKSPEGGENAKIIEHYRQKHLIIVFKDETLGIEEIVLNSDLTGGWSRLLKSKALSIICKKCEEQKIPIMVVLVPLAESYCSNVVSEKGAGGVWQIMPALARQFGLIKKGGNFDDRNDLRKSTDVALSLLKEGYDRTFLWDKRFNLDVSKITESDRWHFALWQYNHSQKKIGLIYAKTKGKSDDYILYQEESLESKHFVHKIFGIKLALQSYLLQKNIPFDSKTDYLAYEKNMFKKEDPIGEFSLKS